MLKKLFVFIYLNISAAYIIADQSSNPASAATNETQPINNPAVGSRQAGSEQIFGNHKISNTQKPAIYKQDEFKSNNPIVGGRQTGSEQLFRQSITHSATSQTHNKPDMNIRDSNIPTGRQAGSEQIFGQSAVPISNTSAAK